MTKSAGLAGLYRKRVRALAREVEHIHGATWTRCTASEWLHGDSVSCCRSYGSIATRVESFAGG
jgi:hypothetical protein